MKTPSYSGAAPAFAVLVFTTLLALPARNAYGDGAPRFTGIAPTPPPSNSQPTAQGHLDSVQKYLTQTQAALAKTTTTNYGTHITDAQTDLTKTLDDVKAATAYVKAHPEINVLKAGPAPNERPIVRPVTIPNSGRTPGVNMITAVQDLNYALYGLINNTSSDYHGPVLGDLGGSRDKIMTDINKISTDLVEGIKSASGAQGGRGGFGGVGEGSPPTSGPANAAPQTTAPVNKAPTPPAPSADNSSDKPLQLSDFVLSDSAPPPDESSGSSRVQTAVAGLAMSAGLSLGGLYFFSRKRAKGDRAPS